MKPKKPTKEAFKTAKATCVTLINASIEKAVAGMNHPVLWKLYPDHEHIDAMVIILRRLERMRL